MDYQQTIAREIETKKGVNVYTRERVSMKFRPAKEGTGIVFIINNRRLAADLNLAELSKTAVFLRGQEASIGLIEHFLPPIYALEIDNLAVEMNFKKQPFACPTFENGSMEIFKTLKEVGTVRQEVSRKYLTIDNMYSFKHWDSQKEDSICVEPDTDFTIDYRVYFPHKAIGEQNFSFKISEQNFCSSLAEARSPAFIRRHKLDEIKISETTHLLIGDENETSYLNRKVRYDGQEFVRHKVLDFLGTLALLGKQFKNTRFKVNMSGHEFDIYVLRKLIEGQCLKETA